MTEQKIRWVCGFEPMREGEYPTMFEVGKNNVTRIERRHENFGHYGIDWFDVYFGDTHEQSIQARAVAEIRYFPTNK